MSNQELAMTRPFALLLTSALLLTVGVSSPPAGAAPQVDMLTVSAAADLARAFPEIGQAFTEQTGIAVRFNFASTRSLAVQIEQGAQVDFFAAADRSTVENLRRQGLTVPGTERTYAYGRLVLCVPPDAPLNPKRLQDLLSPLVRKVAIASPDHAPYGRAAREALQTLGLWTRLGDKIVPADNVRQALVYAETGTADAAIAALALVGGSKVRWVLLPEKLHQPIEQACCVVRGTRMLGAARRFGAFLTGAQGRAILARYGFQLPRARRRSAVSERATRPLQGPAGGDSTAPSAVARGADGVTQRASQDSHH